MWDGAPRWCRRRSDGRSCAGIGTAASPGVAGHMRGVTPITWCTGPREGVPGSRTWSCCVVAITAWSTREVGSPSSSREGDRCSDDPTDRCSRIALHRPRRLEARDAIRARASGSGWTTHLPGSVDERGQVELGLDLLLAHPGGLGDLRLARAVLQRVVHLPREQVQRVGERGLQVLEVLGSTSGMVRAVLQLLADASLRRDPGRPDSQLKSASAFGSGIIDS